MMKSDFDFYLKQIRRDVDKEEIGFVLAGDKIKPVHFASGFFRATLGSRADTNLLGRLVYVVKQKGKVPHGCETDTIMQDLLDSGIVDSEINREELHSLRIMMQNLLSSDSAVFSEKGDEVSYSAASTKFVTSRARYEELGEIGAGIIRQACPELLDCVKNILFDESDEISLLFNPIQCDQYPINEDIGQLPKWTGHPQNNMAWQKYIDSIKRSGKCLRDNIKKQPKLLAIRTIIQFCIIHTIRYLARQEIFHNNESETYELLPILAVYTKSRRSSLITSSKNSFLQFGQSLSRFYTQTYARKLNSYGFSLNDLIDTDHAPLYEKEEKPTKKNQKRVIQNNETWKSAIEEAANATTESEGLLKLGAAIYDMVAIASDTNPNKYIRGIGLKTGFLYPNTARVTPYFRFTQDITNMLVLATVPPDKSLDRDDFLSRLRNDFDVVTGALDSDYEFCISNMQTIMCSDEVELQNNGKEFIANICNMGYGKVLADGIFRVSIGGR